MVKKSSAGILKIIHDKYRSKKKTDPIVERVLARFNEVKESNRELGTMINSALLFDMNPLTVLKLFRRIPEEDVPLLGMNSVRSRPEDLILTRIPVPPVCIRPSIISDLKAGT